MSAVAPSPVETLAATLADGIDRLGLALDEPVRAGLLRFVALLQKWNRAYNLTSVRDPRDMLVVHVLDSLSILPLLDALRPRLVLDVGSGAGLPAIPLALARPDWRFVTVDAVAKKIGFQRQAALELGLRNVAPMHARVEALTLPERPDLIVSRAYTAIPSMIASVAPLATPSTALVAMKGVEPTDELRALPPGWRLEALHVLDVPFLGAHRCAAVLRHDGEAA